MDDLDVRLKQDANAIDAEVPAELRMRIDAALRGIEMISPERGERSTYQRLSAGRLWWVSSLTGLAAAAAVIAIVNYGGPDSAPLPANTFVNQTVPDMQSDSGAVPIDIRRLIPDLDVESAEFTGPLEEELLRLRQDLEKAQESVREDIDFTF